jgi:hypothetical protein
MSRKLFYDDYPLLIPRLSILNHIKPYVNTPFNMISSISSCSLGESQKMDPEDLHVALPTRFDSLPSVASLRGDLADLPRISALRWGCNHEK